MKIQQIKNTIIKGLYQHTKLLVIDTDNNNKKPKHPYYSYKITTIRKNSKEKGNYSYRFEKSENPNFRNDYVEELSFQPSMVMSVNCYSLDIAECQDNILEAWEWFKLKGKLYLSNNNLVVVDVGDIQDRTVALVDNYEYRYGFDVNIRYLHEFDTRLETIEEAKLKGGIE